MKNEELKSQLLSEYKNGSTKAYKEVVFNQLRGLYSFLKQFNYKDCAIYFIMERTYRYCFEYAHEFRHLDEIYPFACHHGYRMLLAEDFLYRGERIGLECIPIARPEEKKWVPAVMKKMQPVDSQLLCHFHFFYMKEWPKEDILKHLKEEAATLDDFKKKSYELFRENLLLNITSFPTFLDAYLQLGSELMENEKDSI